MPKEGGKELAIDLHGDLAGILTVATLQKKPLTDNDALIKNTRDMLNMQNPSSQAHDDDADESDNMPEKQQVKMVAGIRPRLEEKDAKNTVQVKMVAGAGFEPAAFRL